MRNYDEFDEERDLKSFKPESDVNEFGDRLNKSHICAGVLFWTLSVGCLFCASMRGCQEIKKHTQKDKSSIEHAVRISPHDCR